MTKQEAEKTVNFLNQLPIIRGTTIVEVLNENDVCVMISLNLIQVNSLDEAKDFAKTIYPNANIVDKEIEDE